MSTRAPETADGRSDRATGGRTTGGRAGPIARWYLAPAPAERLAVLRVVVGGYALAWLALRTPHLLSLAHGDSGAFVPVGVAAPLDQPVPAWVVQALVAVALVTGVAFVAGWRFRVSGPAFALAFLALTTYRNSFGQVFHTDNLPALHLLVLAFVPAAAVLSADRRRARHAAFRAERDAPLPAPDPRFGWPVRLISVITVCAYVLAGIAKLRTGGLAWVTGHALQHHVAYDNLRKILLDEPHSPFAGVAVRQGWMFPLLAAATLAVELGAPVALRGGRLRTLWVLAAWGFHVGVLALMAIAFPYPLSGVAFASFFCCEGLPRALGLRSR